MKPIHVIRSMLGTLALLGLGCSSEPAPSGGDAAADAPVTTLQDTGPIAAGDGLRLTLNGEVVEFTTNAAGLSGNPTLRWSITASLANPTRALIIGGVPNALGTTPCAVSMTGGQQMSYRAAGINADAIPAGECSVTITQLAPAVGDYVVGTFTGRLMANGGFVGNITNGSFRLRRVR